MAISQERQLVLYDACGKHGQLWSMTVKIWTGDVGQYALDHSIQQLPYKTECGIFSVIIRNIHLIKFTTENKLYVST